MGKMILVFTKKWKEVDEVKFMGKARLVGEVEKDGRELLVWQFYGNEEEVEKIFGGLLVKVVEVGNNGD
jgi:hypothetical protein